jgi:glycosyltransferase involved in cell wall biosynthesis
MRIAVYHNLPSGGAKRTLSEAVRRLASRHDFDVYTLASASHDFADLRPFVGQHSVFPFQPSPLLKSPFGRLNQVIRLADLLRLRKLGRSIARQIEQNDYDVVMVCQCQFEHSPSILRYLRRVPSVFYCQEPLRLFYESMPSRPYHDDSISRRRILNQFDPLPILYRRVLKGIDRLNARAAGKVLVNSQFMAEAVSQVYEVTTAVSYHGVDLEQFRPLPIQKENVVVSAGSLTPLKGFDFLIRALAYFPAERRPTLAIASNFQNPQERSYLEEVARGLGVKVDLLDNVTDCELVKLYNQAKVVVYAPIREPFGLVPLEAMACATPVVAVKEGGICETVIDNQTGFLVERDPFRFAVAVQQLVDNPSLARQFGSNGRELVLGRWTWDRAAASLESHLTASGSKCQLRLPSSISLLREIR